MNVGVVGQKVQRPAVGRQPSRPGRIHEDTGVPTQLACMRFAPVHITSVDDTTQTPVRTQSVDQSINQKQAV